MKLSIFTHLVTFVLMIADRATIAVPERENIDPTLARTEFKETDDTITTVPIATQTREKNDPAVATDQKEDRADAKRTDSDRSGSLKTTSDGIAGGGAGLRAKEKEFMDKKEDLEETSSKKIEVPDSSQVSEEVDSDESEEDSLSSRENDSATPDDESDSPKTAAGEMDHGLTDGLNQLEKEFLDHYKKGDGGHWLVLRNLCHLEIVNICVQIYKEENGREAVAHYMAEYKRQVFKVRLNADEVENFVTDVIECQVETIAEDYIMEFKQSTFYAAEGPTPKSVFKLRKAKNAEDTLSLYGKINLEKEYYI